MRKIISTLGVAFCMLVSVSIYAQQTANNESVSANENGIEYLDGDSYNVRVFPNPTTEFLNVNSFDLVGKSYQVLDLTGKAVAGQQVMNDNLITLNVSSYPSGFYFIKFEDGTLVRFIVKR